MLVLRGGFALLLMATSAWCQIKLNWQPRGDLNATLPSSIQVFEAKDANLPLTAWYAHADLSDTSWSAQALLSEDSDGRETVGEFASSAKSWIAVNGGYFGVSGNTTTSFSLVMQNGAARIPNIGALNRSGVTFYPTRSAWGLREDGMSDIAWVYDVAGVTYAYPAPSPNRQGAPQPQPSANFPAGGAPWPVVSAIGGGPVLVENGIARITWEEEVFFGSGIGNPEDYNPRTAIGYTADHHLLLLVVDGRQAASRGASLIELAQIMIDLGAVEAMNLDGGGSSTFVAGQALVNKPSDGVQRQVATALVLAPKQNEPPDNGDEIIIDTGDTCCYREEGAWFESANTPFWSNTKARLNETGNGSDRAVFKIPALASGRYEVSAWWVAANNRAGNTPFVIYHNGQANTVRADQRDLTANGKWNMLGFFALSSGDSIVITDDASGSTTPAYVCVDAIRLVRDTLTTSVDTKVTPADFALHVFPNPARERVIVRYALRKTSRVTIRLIDVLGRTVREEHVFGASGLHQIALKITGVASGKYVLSIQDEERVTTKAITLIN